MQVPTKPPHGRLSLCAARPSMPCFILAGPRVGGWLGGGTRVTPPARAVTPAAPAFPFDGEVAAGIHMAGQRAVRRGAPR